MDFDPVCRDGLLSLRSRAYDIVVNGEELGGGSIRINDRDVQWKIFQALGLTEREVEEKFGFFLRALDFGAPPHGGIALGMDRVCSMILGTLSIREVIAFPKNRSAFCPLTQAPSEVAHDQLEELGLLNLGGTATIPGMEKQQDLIDSLSWVSRIGVEEKERSAIAGALNTAQRLAEIAGEKAGNEAPLFSIVGAINRVRRSAEAQNSPHSKKGDIFKNAPAVKGNYFKVASILE
jgi:aspartyl-tRNA synthetase